MTTATPGIAQATHSLRRACKGSRRAAREAGSHTASKATALKMIGTVTNTKGSQELTPYRKLARKRVSPNPALMPAMMPTKR